ncbi:MAG: ABC transporter permease, partial [Chthoniobacterales bacterium]
YAETDHYDFASAFHIPTYLFLSLVVAMFLGLTNSVDDVTRDRPILLRERNLNVRLGYYVTAKALTLAFFAVIQCMLYAWVGDALLEVRGMFWIVFATLFLTVLSGIAIGLLVSSMVNESKTAVLFIPVVLIPQIILSGALIKYEEMNRDLDFAYAAQQWFAKHPESGEKPRSDLQVPFICELMPMRWSYEAMIYAQAKLNPLTRRQDAIQAEITALASKPDESMADKQRLEDLKDLLALVSGLRGKSAAEIDRSLSQIDRVIDGAAYDPDLIGSQKGRITAEQIYVNQKVTDLVSKAEMEQFDYRNGKEHLNVFFGPVKEYFVGSVFHIRLNVLVFNTGVLLLTTFGCFFALYFILRRQIRLRGP